jgi:hypothetical protein
VELSVGYLQVCLVARAAACSLVAGFSSSGSAVFSSSVPWSGALQIRRKLAQMVPSFELVCSAAGASFGLIFFLRLFLLSLDFILLCFQRWLT